MAKGPIKSTAAAKKARRLVTAESKKGVEFFPKARAKAREKQYAKSELKRSVTARANVEKGEGREWNFPDPGSVQRANVRVGKAMDATKAAGVSSRGQAKAASKGMKVVEKRVKTNAKNEVASNKRYMKTADALSKGQKKVSRAADVAEKSTRFGNPKIYKKNTGRSVRSR
jgi:hypothetical protein